MSRTNRDSGATETIALMGAGGKMGCRITDRIEDDTAYDVRYVEPSEQGQERLADRGIEVTPEDDALDGADVVIMAVPDELMGSIAADVVPKLEEGTMVMCLDPAAAYAGQLPESDGITYFVAHPCHPPLYEADRESVVAEGDDPDWFGGRGMAQQDVVCALHTGPDEDYDRGEAIAGDIYAPVRRTHRVSTEQMAILEPALVETLMGSCLTAIREGMDEAVEMGVPEQAVRDMVMGHLRIEIAIIFGMTDFPFSDGAQKAVQNAMRDLFEDDWKERVFEMENIQRSVEDIATPDRN